MRYKLYFIDPQDRFMGYIPIVEDDDERAIVRAEKIAVKRPFELWEDRRFVFRKTTDGPDLSMK